MRVKLIVVNLSNPPRDTLKPVFTEEAIVNKSTLPLLAAAAFATASTPLPATDHRLECRLSFTVRQWSPQQAAATGAGMVTCTNGSAMLVIVSARGPGIAAGRWDITDGRGTFAHVARIEDIPGSYAAIEGDIGVSAAGTVQALTKGGVSLRLSGKGRGFSAGIAIRDFSISLPVDSPRWPHAAKAAEPLD